MSWVVTASIFKLILSPTEAGLVNTLLLNLGIIESGEEIYFLNSAEWWRTAYYFINIWRDTGWGTIIFLATLSGINPELYEAAHIDGANRWSCMSFITLPSLANTIIPVLILNLAKIMNLFLCLHGGVGIAFKMNRLELGTSFGKKMSRNGTVDTSG